MFRAYLILLGGLIVAPALVIGSIVLLLDGSVADTSNWRDMLGFGVNSGFGLLIWVIGAKVFRRTVRDNPKMSPRWAIVTKYQPVLWCLGMGLGVIGAFGIIKSAKQNRESLAEIYCTPLFDELSAAHTKCLSIAMSCDDQTDAGPCATIGSASEGERCVEAYKVALERLTDAQRPLLPDLSGGDYEKAMRNICLIEGSSPEQ